MVEFLLIQKLIITRKVGVGDPPEMPYRPSELVFTAPTHAGKRGRGGTLVCLVELYVLFFVYSAD